jgi:hypothetical protein
VAGAVFITGVAIGHAFFFAAQSAGNHGNHSFLVTGAKKLRDAAGRPPAKLLVLLCL